MREGKNMGIMITLAKNLPQKAGAPSVPMGAQISMGHRCDAEHRSCQTFRMASGDSTCTGIGAWEKSCTSVRMVCESGKFFYQAIAHLMY